ncbi:hypothetical protein Ancab_028355 [Ancistrocladus abbreviatus]
MIDYAYILIVTYTQAQFQKNGENGETTPSRTLGNEPITFPRSKGGKAILRIEDTNLERSTKESRRLCYKISLGLVLIGMKSKRNALYKQYAEKLLKSGCVHRCFCSNKAFQSMFSNLVQTFIAEQKSICLTLLRQAFIYKALGFPMPYFAHVSLILACDRSKLSKRHGATSVGQFREMCNLPQAMLNHLALLGWVMALKMKFSPLSNLYLVIAGRALGSLLSWGGTAAVY